MALLAPAPSIAFTCPRCRHLMRVPASFAGRKGRCRGCQTVLQAPVEPAAIGGRVEDVPPGPKARKSRKREAHLAAPWQRLVATFIDNTLSTLALMPAVAGLAFLLVGGAKGNSIMELSVLALLVCGAAAYGGLAVWQWYLIATTGQSLAKGWLGIRIEKTDGSPPGLLHGVVLRAWLAQLVGAVPYVGFVLQPAGLLLIFRDDRRCLHDHIASTRVVVV